MPVETFWIDEPEIYVLHCTGQISAQEIADASETALAAVEDGLSYMLVDFSHVTMWPRNFLLTISLIPSLVALGRHSSLHWLAFVNPDELGRLGIHALVRRRYKLFNTFDEAAAFLRDMARFENSL